MVPKLLAILLIIPIIYAKIEIDISATNENERDVRISGSHVDPISETERKTFDLTEENLKKGISAYFGWTPDSVYLRNPTPYGGLYKSLNWEPVRRVLLPRKAAISSVESKPVQIISNQNTNQESEPKIQKEKIHHNLQTTVSSKWDNNDELTVDDIHYHLDLKKPEGSNYLEFTAQFDEDFQKSNPLEVESEIEYTLKPQQKAKTVVYVTKETMKIKVDYEASLAGSVAMNYDKEYKGHRFWAMDVNAVLEAGGLKKEARSSEVIEVVHYKDAKVLVKDIDTDEVIYSAKLEMH